jgi:hypothetical protein
MLVLAVSGIVYAHHSVLPFDQEKFSVLEGVVSEVRWRNPHVRLKLVVENDAGEKEEWDIEGGAANETARRGVSRNDVKVGDRVRIGGWPSKRGRQELFVINLLLPDGRETIMLAGDHPLLWTEQQPKDAVASADAELERSIFRTWAFAEFYKPSAPFVFTASAQAARAEWEPFTDMLAIQCVAPGMPNAILNPYPIEFIDEGDQIRLRIEEWEATRIIDMVSEEIPDDAPSSLYGYSVGQWVDGVLVIATERVDFPYLDDDGTPMSDQVKMVERFIVSDDRMRLDYKVSVTDPQNLVEPAVWDAAWKYVPGTKIMPFECEPD